ncbi:nuclear transport factor 2 family protein [Streptomyces phaeochromogenes]|uniref:nuclear transport factor 2 family protein n=1 Tax=Streptomyces phaeochromogenes TaxID=1923 RepID=UPI002DDB0E38|nr:nuclear transport factor 2 family protein [Streptomyces phaeochromogenes]WRZ34592.1 nuclear transport factor 2 family protein [Streptomyces phaeochromogenes]
MSTLRSRHPGRSLAALAVTAATLLATAPAVSASPSHAGTATTAASFDAQGRTAFNKVMVTRFFDRLYNHGDLAAIGTHVRPDLIQHNPGLADGAAALRRHVADLKAAHPQARLLVKRVIAQGDQVAVHSNLILEPGTKGLAVVDIVRVQRGRIAEQWEVSQQVPETTVSGNDMFSVISTPRTSRPDPRASAAASEQVAITMFRELAIERDLTALDRHAVDPYPTHSPVVDNGIAPGKELFAQTFAQYPDAVVTFEKVITEGDLVTLLYHMQRTPDEPGLAIWDVFRVQKGKVVEFWDIIQPIPATSANDNSMF